MFICGWLLFSLVPAIIAANKGRSGVGWYFLSLLISPLLAAVLVLVLPEPDLHRGRDVIIVQGGRSPEFEGATKECPYCAETIKAGAVVCRYCGNEVA